MSIALGLGVIGADEAACVTSALGVATGAAIDEDGTAATAVADAEGPVAISPIPPRANANATDALTAITNRTRDAKTGVVSDRPLRTTGAGVSTTTAAPRR